MLKEFRDFITRGNILDLAVAFIMGVAFAAVVTSLVNDIIMPPIGMLLGGVDFSGLFINLSSQPVASLAAAKEAGIATINYGLFINALVTFVIVAFVMFMIVRSAGRFAKEPAPAAVATTKDCPFCLSAVPLKATRCPYCTSQL